MSDCRRTPSLIGRIVDGRATPDDRAHAATCARCGPVLVRAAAFDDELRRSARSLVADELPRGILDQPLNLPAGGGIVARRASPGFAATIAAAAILLLGTVVALAPGVAPLATPSPAIAPTPTPATFVQRFKTTDVIRGQLAKLGYSCSDGLPVSSIGPGSDAVAKESTVCTAPDSIGPLFLAVIVGEAANGRVVEVTIKGDVIGDTTENRGLLSMSVAKVISLPLLDGGVGAAGGLWVKTHLPELEVGDAMDVTLHEVAFRADRSVNGSYHVTVRGVAPS